MFAGQPGAGKSSLALWHAVKWVQHHSIRGIYFSADSSALVQASRSLAMVTQGITVDEAQQMIEDKDQRALDILHNELSGLAWCFDSSITYDVVDQEIHAFMEMWGETPQFIIVDNLFNVEMNGESEWTGLRKITEDLLALGRTIGSHVMVLHHTSEAEKDDPCPPRKAVQGKVNQTPYLILTINGEWVCPVKNRVAPPEYVDKTGRNAIRLNIDHNNFHFSGL